MIEKMKIVRIVTTARHKDDMLTQLRELGAVHFAEKRSADPECTERFSSLSRMASLLGDYAPEGPQPPVLSDEEFDKLFAKAEEALRSRAACEEELKAASSQLESLSEWGEFSPADVRALKSEGYDLHLLKLGKKELLALEKESGVRSVRLAPVGKMQAACVIGDVPPAFEANEFPLPQKGSAELRRDVARCEKGIADAGEALREAAKHLNSFNDQMLKAQNAAELSSVRNTVQDEDGLVCLTGYLPLSEADAFRKAASENGWAWAMDDPAEDDERVPTKIRYSKLTRLMAPVFDILGTVPGYREYDISFWFLCFFALFFAMIIGDAGYGAVFLLCAAGYAAVKRRVNDAVMLLFVLSGATVVWGALTGNWFGLKGAMDIPLLRSLVIPSFAAYPEVFGVSAGDQQNSIMKFCFIIGTVQLALACVMNIRKKFREKSLGWVADVGWLMSICALYFVVLMLVVGESVDLQPIALVVGAGFLLVVLFGGMSADKTFLQGLKAGLANVFTDFLDTISAFGNIMSYIRLFAVGMASLAIAQSFNDMASGFSGPLVIAGALIMIIGHLLNMVMGFLSVVVHGIRLNLLEFSGQLGMEWFGTAYDPFRKRDKLKK